MWYKVKRIYQWTNLVRPVWKPNANTLAYYPLTSSTTTSDMSWNSKTMTNNRNVQFWTYAGVNCWYFSWGSSWGYLSRSWSLWTGNSKYNFSCWFYKTTTWDCAFFSIGYPTGNQWNLCYVETWKFVIGWWNNGVGTDVSCPVNSWHHLVQNFDGTTQRLYLDWVQVASNTPSPNITNNLTCIGISVNTSSTRPMYWYLSEVIFESVNWTAEEVKDYYNWTKAKYIWYN